MTVMQQGFLPPDPSSFIGRRAEIRAVKRAVERNRLVTLTGMGGVGKTRLALHVAAAVARAIRHGVWFMDLAEVDAPDRAGVEKVDSETLAYVVMLRLGARSQATGQSVLEQLTEYLREREALLIFDNAEHVTSVCAFVVGELLRSCPQLRIIVTSRDRLRISGETVHPVPPLQCSPPNAKSSTREQVESVALFEARAREVDPAFELTEDVAETVGEICRVVDGLPLAIELAARWIEFLRPKEILDRLAIPFDLLSHGSATSPGRQQTLRRCVGSSFELCTDTERLLWIRASVFAGGFELEAAEGICAGGPLETSAMLDTISSLIDRSVLVAAEVEGAIRYRMLDTLRTYGLEMLRESAASPCDPATDEDGLRQRHLEWYAGRVERVAAEWISARQPEWIAWVDRELPNIRAALRFGLRHGGTEAALLIAANLFAYWTVRGLHGEGRYWLDHALSRHAHPSLLLVKALCASTSLAAFQADRSAAEEGLELIEHAAAHVPDYRAQAIMRGTQGVVALARGDLEAASAGWGAAAEGLAPVTEPDLLWRMRGLAGFAMTRAMMGDADGAAACHRTIIELCEPRGESWFTGFSMYVLGLGFWRRGDVDAATHSWRNALARLSRVNDTFATGYCIDALAWAAFDQHDLERAAVLIAVADRIADTMGTRPAIFPELYGLHDQYVDRIRLATTSERFDQLAARGASMSTEEAVAYACGHAPTLRGAQVKAIEGRDSLTRREREVANMITLGLTNQEIASRLVVSVRTVEGHLERILTKTGLKNRAQVAAWVAARPSDDHAS